MVAIREESDVVVVGGGPAGLAAAIAARNKGLRVMVIDCAKPAIDKTCGEGLMPDSLAALRALGVRITGSYESFPFRGIRFHGREASVCAEFPGGLGRGLRRTVLHRMLEERARDVGAALLWGTRVTGLSRQGVQCTGGEIRCRWIVGADGQNSRVRKWAGLEPNRPVTTRFGFRTHFAIQPWTDFMEIYWGDGCQIYVTPVSAAEVCVVLISRDSRLRLADVATQFPVLWERLAASAPGVERGAVSQSRRLPRVTRGRILLAGDASGSVDAITGEGLCMAFRQAAIAADVMAAGDLAGYERWHPRAMRRPALMADVMLLLDRFARLREPAIRLLAAQPRLFAEMLAVHTGERPWRSRQSEHTADYV